MSVVSDNTKLSSDKLCCGKSAQSKVLCAVLQTWDGRMDSMCMTLPGLWAQGLYRQCYDSALECSGHVGYSPDEVHIF